MSWVNKATLVFLAANVAIALGVIYLFFWPIQVDVVHNEPFPVYPREVQRGEYIYWDVRYTKTNNFAATINRNIVCADGNLVTLSANETNAPQGDKLLAKGEVVIPSKASIGVCHIVLQATYHVNPVRDIIKTYQTQDFLITE